MPGLQDWWDEIPPVTKVLFGASFAVTLGCHFGFLSYQYLGLTWIETVKQFQIWRFFTNFFVYGLGFPFLVLMIFLYQYSKRLELGYFAGKMADYIWFLVLGAIVQVILGFYWPLPYLGKGLILQIVYFWSRVEPPQQMSMMFGITFMSPYFPWVLVVMDLLMGKSVVISLVGILAGHVYWYLKVVCPHVYPNFRDYLATPSFLYNILPLQYNINAAYFRQRQQQEGPHRWGGGYRLGGQ